MLDDTFKKMDEMFKIMTDELSEVFKSETKTEKRALKISNSDGHIEIEGSFKSLHINGKLVRFK